MSTISGEDQFPHPRLTHKTNTGRKRPFSPPSLIHKTDTESKRPFFPPSLIHKTNMGNKRPFPPPPLIYKIYTGSKRPFSPHPRIHKIDTETNGRFHHIFSSELFGFYRKNPFCRHSLSILYLPVSLCGLSNHIVQYSCAFTL